MVTHTHTCVMVCSTSKIRTFFFVSLMHLISAVHFYARQQHLAAPPRSSSHPLDVAPPPSAAQSCLVDSSVTSQTETVPLGTNQLVADETFTKKPCCPVQRREASTLLVRRPRHWHCPAAGGQVGFHPLLNLHVNPFWARFALSKRSDRSNLRSGGRFTGNRSSD